MRERFFIKGDCTIISDSVFIALTIRKLTKIYDHNAGIFVFKYPNVRNILPNEFNYIHMKNDNVHDHRTRQKKIISHLDDYN